MPSRAHVWTMRYLRLCGVALPLVLALQHRPPPAHAHDARHARRGILLLLRDNLQDRALSLKVRSA